jgi:hypothetical protein
MTPVWAQRQEELLRDCVVSPQVFDHMVDHLRDFVVPYQHALATEAGKRNGARSQLSGQVPSRAKCEVAIRFNMFHRPAL